MPEWALPHINLELCTRCGTCVEQCPGHAVEMTADGPSFVQPFNCTYCARCEDLCPQNAITCTYTIGWDSALLPHRAQGTPRAEGNPLRSPRRNPEE